MPYPRVCAHRGFNTIAPENSLPAFGAAIALGAQEIEFDLWETKDGHIVSIHDSKLDRVSDGTGYVWDYTLEELRAFDFGKGYEGAYGGLWIVLFEEILKKFSCHVIMNIHVKSRNNVDPLDETYLKNIVALIRKYDCAKYVYFMTGNDTLMKQFGAIAPDICRCVGGGNARDLVVERAIEMGCQKVQFMRGHFSKEKIELAHAHGIVVKTTVLKEERTAGVAALDGALGIVPAVDHAQGIGGLILAKRQRFAGLNSHHQPVCAVKNAGFAAQKAQRAVFMGKGKAVAHCRIDGQGDLRETRKRSACQRKLGTGSILWGICLFGQGFRQKRKPGERMICMLHLKGFLSVVMTILILK